MPTTGSAGSRGASANEYEIGGPLGGNVSVVVGTGVGVSVASAAGVFVAVGCPVTAPAGVGVGVVACGVPLCVGFGVG